MELNTHKIDICALSETKKKGKGTSRYPNHILVYSGKPKEEYANSGVGFLIHERWETNIEDIAYISHRILKVTFLLENNKLHMISVYAPDMGRPEQETDSFYDNLQEVIDELPRDEKVIVLGDLNARIGNEIVDGIKQRFNEDVTNCNGESLTMFCAQNNLRINNTYFPQKPRHKYTWSNTQNNKSTLDYIISNQQIHPTQIKDVRALTSANIGSDHNMVLARIEIKMKTKKRRETNPIQKLNIEKLEDATAKWLYEQRLRYKFETNQVQHEDNMEDSWEKIKHNIIEAAKESIGIREVKTGGNAKTKPWFTEEIRTLAYEKRKAYIQYRSNQTHENHQHYKRTRNEVNAEIRRLRREYWTQFTKDMEHDLYGSQRKVWKMLKASKQPVNEYRNVQTVEKDKWIQYIQQLYNTEEMEINRERPQEYEHTINEEINVTTEIVTENIRKLKNRKAPGTDGICNELLKYGGQCLNQKIVELFQKILKDRQIPDEWRTSITVPIYKKGGKKDPSNYRTITLMNTTLKLMTKIISNEITNKYNIREEQMGFRQNRSTTDAIFVIRQITEKAIEFDVPAYICLIDLTKAFDRVRLRDVIDILNEENMPQQIIELIRDINTRNKTKVKVDNELTGEIDITSGIRQGDSLSPLLFNLLMDKLIGATFKKGQGYKLGNKEIRVVCYADDMAIISNNEDELQRMVHEFVKSAKMYNMEISTTKTKTLVAAREPKRCKIVINDKIIEQVTKIDYLGIEISGCGDWKEGVRKQANKASRISGCLRDIVWRNKDMRTESKVRIYKSCVRPVLTYAIETRGETAETKRMLRTTEMKTLRTIAGKTLRDRIPNTEIREMCEVQDVVRWGRQRRRGWNQHINRMSGDRLVKISRDGNPPGKRPRGRPPKRWRESWQSTSQVLLMQRQQAQQQQQ